MSDKFKDEKKITIAEIEKFLIEKPRTWGEIKKQYGLTDMRLSRYLKTLSKSGGLKRMDKSVTQSKKTVYYYKPQKAQMQQLKDHTQMRIKALKILKDAHLEHGMTEKAIKKFLLKNKDNFSEIDKRFIEYLTKSDDFTYMDFDTFLSILGSLFVVTNPIMKVKIRIDTDIDSCIKSEKSFLNNVKSSGSMDELFKKRQQKVSK